MAPAPKKVDSPAQHGFGLVRADREAERILLTDTEAALVLRRALDARGGVACAFRHFLQWRSDILTAEYLEVFRGNPRDWDPIPLETVRTIVKTELPAFSEGLNASLEPAPLWSTLSRTAYRATFRGSPVVLQVGRPLLPDKEFDRFDKALAKMPHAPASLLQPAVLLQFREWMRAGVSCDRERAYLRVLSRDPKATLAGYPEVIPEICGPNLVGWRWKETKSLLEALENGESGAAIGLATAVLEQFCSLGLVEAELSLDALGIDENNSVYFRRICRPVSVPPSLVNEGMKYVAAVLAGGDAAAAYSLLRLARGSANSDVARRLLDSFSSIEPFLRMDLHFPVSCATFESNWRALAILENHRPMYLDCFHRNFVALGYWCSTLEKVNPGFRWVADPIEEGHWPVMGRLIRAEAGGLMNRETAGEWLIGASLFSAGAIREMSRLADEIRENNLTMGVEMAGFSADTGDAVRTMRRWVLFITLAAAFFGSIEWGMSAPAPWHWAARLVAVLSAIGLFRLLSTMG